MKAPNYPYLIGEITAITEKIMGKEMTEAAKRKMLNEHLFARHYVGNVVPMCATAREHELFTQLVKLWLEAGGDGEWKHLTPEEVGTAWIGYYKTKGKIERGEYETR